LRCHGNGFGFRKSHTFQRAFCCLWRSSRIPEGIKLRDERDATPNYKEEKKEQQVDSLNRIVKAMGIDGGLEIWLGGDLRAASGVGPPAARQLQGR